MSACKGAYTGAYIIWTFSLSGEVVQESDYPYLNENPNLVCPKEIMPYNFGAKVIDKYEDYACTEDHLQKLVHDFGAVEVGIYSRDESFQNISNDEIFQSCTPNGEIDHSVTVVGYGVEDGVKYWKVKNSWGDQWGNNGFFRIIRGKNECGIGTVCVTARCTKTD